MKPYAEIGINDESGYVHTALVFAATHHIVYSGIVTPMLLWQVVFAAPFVWLLGPSFTAVRLAVAVISVATAALMQRSFVRSGLTEWNAMFGTLLLIVSPVCLSLEFHFMSDVPGFFAIVLCFYCCLRAVQSTSRYGHLIWIVVAALTNVIGGTGRQIAWLGVLVMVPSTAWLLRKKEKALAVTAAVYAVSFVLIVAILRWFSHQPYTQQEASMMSNKISLHTFEHLFVSLLRSALDLSLYLLPALLPFVVRARLNARGWTLTLVAAALLLAPELLHHPAYRAPFLGNYLTGHGVIDGTPLRGERPTVLPVALQLFLSIASAVCLVAFFQWLRAALYDPAPAPEQIRSLSWRTLSVLIVPFLIGYGLFLIPRGAIAVIYDRYLLCLFMFAALALLRLYQERISTRLPALMVATAVLYSAYAVAVTHDAFSMYRGRAQADNRLLAAGIPREQIDGGFEFNAWTETVNHGSLHKEDVPLPPGMTLASQPISDCRYLGGTIFHDVKPRYAISYDPNDCDGPSSFPPAVYTEWLGPRSVPIYTVNVLPREP